MLRDAARAIRTSQPRVALRADHVIVRISDVGLACTTFDGASSPFDSVYRLEQNLVSLSHVPTVAHACPRLFADSAQSQLPPRLQVRPKDSLCLLLGPDLDELELTLVSFAVDLKLLRGPIPYGACAEFLLRESDVRYLLSAFIDLYSRHLSPTGFGYN